VCQLGKSPPSDTTSQHTRGLSLDQDFALVGVPGEAQTQGRVHHGTSLGFRRFEHRDHVAELHDQLSQLGNGWGFRWRSRLQDALGAAAFGANLRHPPRDNRGLSARFERGPVLR
jgi:hypothetical protein